MKSALILLLLSFSLLHGEGDEHSSIDFGNGDDDFKWERGEVLILENQEKRQRRGIETNLVQLISGGKTINISLELSHNSLNSISLRNGDETYEVPLEEQRPCHWRGQVEGGGVAAFSTCQHPNAFEGIVKTDEGLWLVRPDLSSGTQSSESPRSRFRRQSSPERVRHLIASPESVTAKLSSLGSAVDVARVPLKELENAARLAAQESIQREAEQDLPVAFAFTKPDYDHYDSYFPNWFDYNYHSEGDIFNQPLGTSHQFDRVNLRGQVFQANPSHLERKSRTLENKKKKWVEMAVFTDEPMYKRMEKKFPNDTLIKLKDYTTTLINTMDLLYRDKSLGVDIGFRLVHLEIMKKTPKEIDSNGGKAKAYLTSFCQYAGNKNTNSALWDHALLLTGIDVHENGIKSTAGLAWAGTMCYKYYSCSVAEGYSFGSAFIITHEMGHSLGMEHDGVGVSETCDKDKYIMSPTTGAGKVNWSNCSGKNLQDFIEYGTSELRAKKYQNNLQSKPTCLSELASKTKVSSNTKSKLPGESYDAYFQCSLGLGSEFKPYFQRNKTPFNNICWILYCGNGTHAISTHPALEGTKCDKEKYCRGGVCIKKPKR